MTSTENRPRPMVNAIVPLARRGSVLALVAAMRHLADELEASVAWMPPDGVRVDFSRTVEIPLRDGLLTLDASAYLVRWQSQMIILAERELALLSALAEEPARWKSTAALVARIWGPECLGARYYVGELVARVRRKVGPTLIESRKGAGYRLMVAETETEHQTDYLAGRQADDGHDAFSVLTAVVDA